MSFAAAGAGVAFELEAAQASDFESLHALRLRAMRESLERLGRYDEARSRERLAASFDPARTWHIVADGVRVGFLVLKRLSHALRLDHLYIDLPHQGRGIGHAVVASICERADREQLPIELVVLKGSEARHFYLRHGFVATGQGDWDIDYLRPPVGPSARAVRAMWAAFQARDWDAARALMHDGLQARWWTSGERFDGADAFVAVQRAYPEGWTIRLLEVSRLEDGRVMSLVRVDQPPQAFFATSLFVVDDGRILRIDEYWATAEAPPEWRQPGRLAGLTRFDALDDPRAVTP